MKQLIECVPNFSEGRDAAVIRAITGEIERVDGVKLLDVDSGLIFLSHYRVGMPGPYLCQNFR